MNILGIQKNHNGSIALFKDYELVYYNQEERLSKIKNDSYFPINCINEIKKLNIKIDKVLLTGYNTYDNHIVYSYLKKINLIDNVYEQGFHYWKSHHLIHAAKAFYTSKMDKALIIVADGRGSTYQLDNGENAYETLSVYNAIKPFEFYCIYKKLFSSKLGNERNVLYENQYHFFNKVSPLSLNNGTIFEVSNQEYLGSFYAKISSHLNFELQEGKLMGLQAYGKNNKKIKTDLENNDFFKYKYKYELDYNIGINLEKYNYLYYNKNVHKNFKQEHLDLAFETQKKFEQEFLNLIETHIGSYKNIILTGGAALNVVNNYKIKKNLPTDVNLFIDPLCGDEGNSIGVVLLYLKHCNFELDNIYLNPEPKYNIKQGKNKIEESIEVLEKGNILALYQGKAEAGPRALGNRSLLLDPRLKNGKEIMNTVKNREFFRPFGCSVLEEEANKWFDMAGLKESPYMLYAVNVIEKIKEKIPSVVHVDGTCRIQTVNEKQNPILYKILKLFYKKTGVPILMNTSFNLAGETLVETPEDAIDVLKRSKLEYLYFSDINKLIYKYEFKT